MADGLARYQLTTNPYELNRALDPIMFQGDDKMLIEVDGFGSISGIDKHLITAINEKKCPFFMITGKNGTGRSTFANYLLARYCTLSGTDPKHLIVPNREYTGHDKVYIIKQWFGFLRTAINRKKISLPGEVKTDLKDYLATTTLDTLEPNFKDIAQRIGDELTADETKYGMACYMEDVEDFDVIDAALKIFNEVPMVCVFTVRDYPDDRNHIITPFVDRSKKLTGCGIFELSRLSSSEIKKVVDMRWQHYCELKNPFDLDCIEEVFKDKHRTIGLSLTIMAELLTNKLANHPIGDEWPHAPELAFTCDQLRKLVPLVENKL